MRREYLKLQFRLIITLHNRAERRHFLHAAPCIDALMDTECIKHEGQILTTPSP